MYTTFLGNALYLNDVTIIVHQKIPPENLKSYEIFFFTIKQFLKEPVDMLQINQYSCICNSLCTCNKGIIINHAMNRYAFFFLATYNIFSPWTKRRKVGLDQVC